MKHNAFTMLELVFVIVVAGIIMVLAIPRMDDSNLRQAANQVVRHIQYTQHLAMMDDKFDDSDSAWFKKRWQIAFNSDAKTYDLPAYTIFTDGNTNSNPNLTLNEVAIDPLTGDYMTGGYSNIIASDATGATKEMNLGLTYGINDFAFSSSCQYYNSTRISFDYLGRPLKGVPSGFTDVYKLNRLIQTPCSITLCKNSPCDDENITISIEPETGYTHILN